MGDETRQVVQVEPNQECIRENTGGPGGGNGTGLKGVIHETSVYCIYIYMYIGGESNLVGDGGVVRGDSRGIPATSSRLQL